MRHVPFFEQVDFVRRQFEREGRDRIVQMMQLGRADNWRRDRLFLQHPRKRDLRPRHAPIRRDPADLFDDLTVRLFGVRIQRAAEFVRFRARAAAVPVTRQTAPCERAPR